jgi:microsomal dipeptidase-like Zn-dependent dipeptidase
LIQQSINVEAKAAAAGIGIAKTAQELDNCIANDKPFLFHVVEGGHALSGDPANMQRLAEIKACYLTLAHMRYMGLASCAKTLPCKTDFWNKILDPDEPNCGLMPLGFDVLDALFATNVALDLTHCSDMSQSDIIQYHKSHNVTKPVISSHCGVRGIANTSLNLSDETIEFIGSTGGVIGVILWTYSLGADTSTQGGFEKYCQTIEYIRNKAGDDAVAIGSDLDGFIQPIADCRNYSNIGNFAAMLKQRYDGEPEFLEKLLWRNARRVLVGALG